MATVTITARQKAKIEKAIKALNDVRSEIQFKNPDNDIQWYLEDCGNLHLMEGDTHNNLGNAQKDRVITHDILENSSGGGW